ncbi:hypothetical protein LC048_05970 [Mesobacillus subterraneus]|uniref:thiolase family protein n=1 Tax=Mesobacillus subterraneus TaxID=285983 RepID=UPI00273EDE99|nr:hypothetical protein [Mesobacillus subterraneus]WLR56457.1 hypothetical protein LC048_05970 [Mesobacillus subterraneus]
MKKARSRMKSCQSKFRSEKEIRSFLIRMSTQKKGTTAEKLGGLRPAFKKDGSVTAGNASGINDGAAALVVMSRAKAEELGLKPLVVIKGNASAGVDPKHHGHRTS